MPLYEYQCKACGHDCELLEKVSDIPTAICPACGKESLSRQVSASSFQLKGDGWYVTDFKDKNKDKGKAKENSEPKKNDESKNKTDVGGE